MSSIVSPVWDLLDQGAMDGSVNMALDEVLLYRASSRPVLRFYQWKTPTLTLGMSQPVERHVNIAEANKRKVAVIRRLTGGKAVLHDSELTYSITGSIENPPFDRDLLDSYRNIAMAFCEAFERMGLNADMASRETRSISGSITSCFASSSAFEILVEGRKLLGSAQKRTRNRVLQHGSLLIDYREKDWNALMRRKTSLDIGQVVDLRFLLGPNFSISMVKTVLIQAFESYFGVKTIPLQLAEEELSKAMEIAQNKYLNLMG